MATVPWTTGPTEKINELIFHTGNISGATKLTKRATQSAANELLSGVEGAVESWLTSPVEERTGNGVALVQHVNLAKSITSSDRQDLMITIKVFVLNWDENLVRDAITCALDQLGLQDCDMVILALPASNFSLDKAKPLWMEVELFATRGRALVVGVADLNMKQLEQLHDWAHVKPTVNQVNLASCCVMPEDLVEYAKRTNIKLFTHNDDSDLITSEMLSPIISKLHVAGGNNWEPSWVVRYSTQVKCRGILGRRGYFVHAKRCLH